MRRQTGGLDMRTSGMATSFTVRVMFPNRVIEQITVQGIDTPRTLALSGPTLTHPVILLHKGRCLCPYTSLDSQGVASGDLVILHPIGGSESAFRGPPELPAIHRETERRDQEFNEILRLADLGFAPYEASPFGSAASQQMWKDDQEDPAATRPEATNIGKAAPQISDAPLPVCWADKRVKSGRRKQPQ
jgi:hypothetical protein